MESQRIEKGVNNDQFVRVLFKLDTSFLVCDNVLESHGVRGHHCTPRTNVDVCFPGDSMLYLICQPDHTSCRDPEPVGVLDRDPTKMELISSPRQV